MGGEDVYKSYYCWFEAAKQQSSKAKNNQKTTKKTTKFDPEWGRGYPKSTQNRAKIETNALNHPKWPPDGSQMASKTPLLKLTGGPGTILGSPLGPQNRPKIDFLRQRVLQGTLFYRF